MTALGIAATCIFGSLSTAEAIRVAYFRPTVTRRGSDVMIRVQTGYVLANDIALCVLLAFIFAALGRVVSRPIGVIAMILLVGAMIILSMTLRVDALIFQDDYIVHKRAFLRA